MKYRRMCPKCGSGDIAIVDGTVGSYGSGNHIMIGWTGLSAVMVDRYICCHCGFTEEWIRREDLERLKNSKKVHRENRERREL